MSTTCCRHIRTNGRRCGAVALRGKPFCYFHIGLDARHRPLKTEGSSEQDNYPFKLDFPALEDRESIQVAISMLLTVLGQNLLPPRRAATMLYALKVASINVRDIRTEPAYAVDHAITDTAGTNIAPDDDPPHELDLAEILNALDEDPKPPDLTPSSPTAALETPVQLHSHA